MISDEERAEIRRAHSELGDRIEAEVPGFTFDRHWDGWHAFGGAAPWQANGKLDGRNVYLRFRHNQASMDVWEGTDFVDDGTIVDTAVIHPYYPEGHPEYHVHTTAPLDEDIARMIRELISSLSPVSEENPTAGMLIGREVDRLTALMKPSE